ncbi:9881_t:CDS:1, partial [Gigaspora rosea]
FYEYHIIQLREHVIDIQKDKWSGYKKPYISKALNEVLHLPEEPPSIKDIKKEIVKGIQDEMAKEVREIKNVVKNILDSINNLKQ